MFRITVLAASSIAGISGILLTLMAVISRNWILGVVDLAVAIANVVFIAYFLTHRW